MEIEQLEQLVAVRRYGTISAAAGRLHISQPALSRSIQRLEKELGQELFDRGHNRVVLNDAGELAIRHAERILADIRLMRNDFDELAQRDRALSVAAVAPAPVWRLTALVIERFPGSIVEPDILDEQQVDEAIANRACDFAITRHPIALPTVRSVPLMTEDLSLRVPEGSPLASRRSVSFSDFDGETLLLFRSIGFWMDMVREHSPNSRLVVQDDRVVFTQLMNSTDMLCFTTDAPENEGDVPGRVAVPIVDADAHATYFLVAPTDASQRVLDVVDWVEKNRPSAA
jgi:DNA-binding transcriptional LysR family regulator